jgi:hypothetical protein
MTIRAPADELFQKAIEMLKARESTLDNEIAIYSI